MIISANRAANRSFIVRAIMLNYCLKSMAGAERLELPTYGFGDWLSCLKFNGFSANRLTKNQRLTRNLQTKRRGCDD